MIHNPNLDGGPFDWQGSSQGVLLIHGFTATTAEVRPLAKRLYQVGYTVSGPLLPGHNTHPRDLNRVHWQDWTTVAEESLHNLSKNCSEVVVGGESTGALLSLYLALRHPEIKALLLYAPALRLNLTRTDKLRLHLFAIFKSWVPKPNLDNNPLWQGYPVNPLKGVLQLLALQQQIRPYLEDICQPMLLIQGRLDRTVHPQVPDEIASRVQSGYIEKHWMERSTHCVILDQEMDQVFELTLNFLRRFYDPRQ